MTTSSSNSCNGITVNEITADSFDNSKNSYDICPFIESSWVESFRCEYRKPVYFEFIKDNHPVGLASGIIVKSTFWLLEPASKRIYLFGMPCTRGASLLEVVTALKGHLQAKGLNVATLFSYFNLEEPFLAGCGFQINTRKEFLVDLEQPVPQLWSNLSKNRKRIVNKCKKLELTITQSQDISAVDRLMDCLRSTKDHRTEKGRGNYSYFVIPYMNEKILRKQLSLKIASVYLVHHQGEMVSTCYLVRNAGYAYGLLWGSTPKGYELGAQSFMLWKIIELMKEDHCRQLNLGGMPTGEGADKIADFKLSLGSRIITCEGGKAALQTGLREQIYKSYRILSEKSEPLKELLRCLKKTRGMKAKEEAS